MRKNMIVAALLGALAVLTPRAWSVNTQDALTAEADKTAFGAIVVGGAGASDLAHLYYLGTATEALVTIAATHMDFFAPGTVIDTSIGSGVTGVITYASLGANTMGSLCDYINASTYYRCQLTGAMRGEAPSILTTQTETSGTCNLKTAGGCKLTNAAVDTIRLGIVPPSGRRVVLTSVQAVGVSATDNVNVYGILRPWSGGKDNLGTAVTADTNVWSTLDGGAGTLGYAPASSQYAPVPWLEFASNNTPMALNYGGLMTSPVAGSAYDGRVAIRLGTIGSGLTQTSADYLRVMGYFK